MHDTIVDAEILRDAVRLACHAPSLHNSQPWGWVAEDAGLQLFCDPSRILHSTDESGREALISCGAVLHHLRVTMAAAGWTSNVVKSPDPDNRDHLASINFSVTNATDGDRRRADAILRRRSDRLPLAEPENWESLEAVLRTRCNDDGIFLDVVPEEFRPQLAKASRLTESLRRSDSDYQSELNWWTAPSDTSDGIPQSSLVSAAESD